MAKRTVMLRIERHEVVQADDDDDVEAVALAMEKLPKRMKGVVVATKVDRVEVTEKTLEGEWKPTPV